MATHSSILAWEISWRVEPGGLQFKGLQRVRYNLATQQQQQINRGNDQAAAATKSHQLCLTFCDVMDRTPPGSSVRGIAQARILEWVAIPFSRGSS